MGVTNANKQINVQQIDCNGTLQVTLALAAAPDITENPTDMVLLLDRSGSMAGDFHAIAFGCPAMGAEELEETEFAPMFQSCESALSGKKIALFGSYGWGDGDWMRSWEDTCRDDGAVLACESVICQEQPDDEALEKCKALGAALN